MALVERGAEVELKTKERTMNSRIRTVGAVSLSVASAFGMTGCGCLVGSKEYLANAKGAGFSIAAEEGFPRYVAARPRAAGRAKTVVISMPDIKVEADRKGNDPSSPSFRLYYASVARNQLAALDRELALLENRARLKGGAALAAIDPEVRDYNLSVDLLEESLWEASGARNADEFEPAAHAIAAHLSEARDAVRDAARLVTRTPMNTSQEPVDRDI